MNILSKVLSAGYDVHLESAYWSGLQGSSTDMEKFHHYKLIIKKHGSESFEVLGAVSKETAQGDKGDEVILITLNEMFKLLDKD